MSFLPTAFLTFFFRERSERGREEEKFKKAVERHGMDLKK